jgi:hypothetical protein
MVKVRVASNRLSVGSWSIPLRSKSPQKDPSRNFNGTAAAIAKEEYSNVTSDASPATKNIKPSLDKALNPSLVELAATITRETEKLERYLKDRYVLGCFDMAHQKQNGPQIR